MKKIHTHRGHCQLCAKVQAIDVGTGIVAKHGYTVEQGYYSGQCPGSEALSLHVSRELADKAIAEALREAAIQAEQIDRFNKGTAHPATVWNGEYEWIETRGSTGRPYKKQVEKRVAWEEADESFREIGLRRAIGVLENRQRTCEHYARDVKHWADKITGKVDPYQVHELEPKEFAVGDTIHIGGKKGFDAVIEAIEDQKYTTYGYRYGRSTIICKHARVTRPAKPEKRAKDGYVISEGREEAVLWVALRDIKRPPTPLAEELKREGKL